MADSRVLVLGTFDALHAGHIRLLERAKAYGDKLIVGVNDDEFVESYKGERPLFTTSERLTQLRNFGYNAEYKAGPGRDFIEHHSSAFHRFAVAIVAGTDWSKGNYLAQLDVTENFLVERNISLVFVPYTQGISTSQIVERVRQRDRGISVRVPGFSNPLDPFLS